MANRELEAGEGVKWMGMPQPRFFTTYSKGAFLFAIPWTAFALFWVAGAAGFQIPDFKDGFAIFPLFGLPFVLLGIWMLLTPLFVYLNARKTLYMITDKRAVVFEGGSNTTIRSFEPEQLNEIIRKERNNGLGDLVFKREFSQKSLIKDIGFINIEDSKEVERKIKEMIQNATRYKERLERFGKSG
jgi:hypothetical protein